MGECMSEMESENEMGRNHADPLFFVVLLGVNLLVNILVFQCCVVLLGVNLSVKTLVLQCCIVFLGVNLPVKSLCFNAVFSWLE